PMIQSPSSDMTRFFEQQVMGGEPVTASVVYATSDSDMAARVSRDPGGIGFVSLGGRKGSKALRLSTLTGLSYWKPDPEAVYKGDYPLTRFFTFYVRSAGPRLAAGFITYVTSFEGQKLVYESGLVPTSIPVRFVRRSPMLSTHQ